MALGDRARGRWLGVARERGVPRPWWRNRARAENDKRWRPGVVEIRRRSGAGAGTVYEQRVKGPFGSKVHADVEIVDLEPGRRIGFRTIAGPVRPEGAYELEPVDEGTRVTFELRAELRGARKVMAPMVERTMRSEVGQLENLRLALERAGGSPS